MKIFIQIVTCVKHISSAPCWDVLLVVGLAVGPGQSVLHQYLECLEVNTPLQKVCVILQNGSDEKLRLGHVIVSIDVGVALAVTPVRFIEWMGLAVAGRRVKCGVGPWYIGSTALLVPRVGQGGGGAKWDKHWRGLDHSGVHSTVPDIEMFTLTHLI